MPTAPGPLEEAGYLDEAQVYAAMFTASGGHATPRVVDEMELWEIATCLGVPEELNRGDEPKQEKRPMAKGADDFQRRSRELIEARVRHAKGLGPMPEAQPIDKETFQRLTGSLP